MNRIQLLTAAAMLSIAAQAQNPTVNLTVDANANRKPINPGIYGVAYATTTQLQDLNVKIHRYGGNNTSRYNWQLNADNRGQDWYFQSIPEASAVAGERGATFISTSRAGGAEAMLTIPIIDWVAKLGTNRSKLASFSQAKYGAQTDADWQWFPDAGNGILASNGQFVQNNNKNDANVPNSVALQQQWVQSIVNQWGLAQNGGQKYYILDNEHSIWHSTHRDVQPVGATMDETFARMRDYAAAIKAVDPGAKVVGPEEWGWSGFLLSGYDQQYGGLHGWSFMPDRSNHGGSDYLPWILNQFKLDGRHLLDTFTVHWYPQGGEFSDTVTTSMQQTRNRSTRALWDPSYVDPTWINDTVKLIPRLRSWADTYYYPGTPIGITEYNWGAENHINGATTQADILGIFGREGLDIGARWTTPATTTPTYKAIKMYRNYDGNKSTFGDVNIAATSAANPDNVATFAAERTADGSLTVMVINKYLSGNTPVNVALSNFSAAGTAQVYQLTSANAINRLTDIAFTGSSFAVTVPAQSVTLLVLPKSSTTNQPPDAVISANPLSGIAPLTVAFSAASSTDPDGSISTYSWNFGDGGTATGATTSHLYQNPGNYTAVLTVTDNQGATDTAQVAISATTNPNVLNAPSNLTGTGAKSKATLNWTDNSNNETGFYIERAVFGTTTYAQVGQVAANVKTFQQTVTKGKYNYRVRAFNSTTTSAYSNVVIVQVK